MGLTSCRWITIAATLARRRRGAQTGISGFWRAYGLCPAHGWALLFADKHPYAGGKDHYAAYLANSDGYEVELIADSP
jgi:hypothetical protein